MTPALAASLLPSALTALPTAAMVGVLCAAVIGEIVITPTVLPGATITLVAGALIGAGRPALAVAVPLIAAIVAGDQLAYFGGAAVIRWLRRRRPGRPVPRERRGRVESWLAAAMPSLAGAAGLRYRQFVPRVLVLRVPWLVAALGAGMLAAKSLARLGHVIGLAGVITTGVVVLALVIFRRRGVAGRRAAGPHQG